MMATQKDSIGEKVKSLRLAKGISLEEASRETGIPAAVLSGIEDLSVSPPLGNIVSLANLFRVTVGELFGDSADAPFCIVRSDERESVSRFSSAGGNSGGYNYQSLGQRKQNRNMEPFLVTLVPKADAQVEPNQHEGEEILFVLEGQVKVSLAEHTDILNPGDSIYYDSTLPHVVSCHGDRPATILAVIYAKKEMIIF